MPCVELTTGLALALGVSGALLLVVSLVTARRPSGPMPDRAGYLDRWSVLHGGHDPRGNVWLRGWLSMTYRIARPLARVGVLPDVLTVWSVWFACLVFLPAAVGGRWLLLAGWLLVASGLGDSIDGAVAAMTDRATRFGYVLDSVVDRVNELLYLAAVVLVGGPLPLALACGVLFFLHEYLRARAGNAGAGEVVAVTVGERASRVIVLAGTLILGGVFTGHVAVVATVGLWVLSALAVAGFVQLVVAARRLLAGVPGTPGP
jgi:phosphatidylglycerophosphate synthase